MVGFVAFSGVDCAGKSTQIEMLRQALEARGIRARVFWARGGYTPGMALLKRLARRALRRALPVPGRSPERERRFTSVGLRRLWLGVAILDLGVYWGLWLRLWRWRGGVAIADRYLCDTLLDFQLNFPGECVDRWLLWNLLRVCIPQPQLQLVLVVPVEESERRARLKNEPFGDASDVRRARLEYYERVVVTSPSCRLNGQATKDELHAEIWSRAEATT